MQQVTHFTETHTHIMIWCAAFLFLSTVLSTRFDSDCKTADGLTSLFGILSLTTIALAENKKMNKKSNKIFECLQSTEIDTRNNFEKKNSSSIFLSLSVCVVNAFISAFQLYLYAVGYFAVLRDWNTGIKF